MGGGLAYVYVCMLRYICDYPMLRALWSEPSHMTLSGQLARLREERKGASTKFIFLYLVYRLRKEIKFEMFAGR